MPLSVRVSCWPVQGELEALNISQMDGLYSPEMLKYRPIGFTPCQEPTCGDIRMIGKPGQEAPFDCSQFDMPVGRALSMKHVDVRCKFKNDSVDLPASVCNCW
jgi:hypothetical protein